MSLWLVSTAMEVDAYNFGPAAIVEARTASAAAKAGIEVIAQEDGGHYGIECKLCDSLAVTDVAVVLLSECKVFVRQPGSWKEKR